MKMSEARKLAKEQAESAPESRLEVEEGQPALEQQPPPVAPEPAAPETPEMGERAAAFTQHTAREEPAPSVEADLPSPVAGVPVAPVVGDPCADRGSEREGVQGLKGEAERKAVLPPVRRKYDQPELRVVVFKMDEHEYVVDVAHVQEIIRPTGLMHMDGVPEYVEGLVKRRGRVVPIVDLRKRLGLGVTPPTTETCVIIAKLSIGPVGFLVDSASELMWVKTQDFEVPSPVIAGVDQLYIQGVAHLGDRLLVMLDLQQLLTPGEQRMLSELRDYAPDDFRTASCEEESGRAASCGKLHLAIGSQAETLFAGQIEERSSVKAEQERERADLHGLVAFELSGELYGVSITEVAEIRDLLEVMPLPRMPAYIRGLINLRGVVLPVVDLRHKFELPIGPKDQDNRLLILKNTGGKDRAEASHPGELVALWVDAVRGLVRLPKSEFQPAPPGVARIDPEYYEQVATLEGRMLIELDIQKLLADTAAK